MAVAALNIESTNHIYIYGLMKYFTASLLLSTDMFYINEICTHLKQLEEQKIPWIGLELSETRHSSNE